MQSCTCITPVHPVTADRTLPGAPKEAWINPEGRHMGSDAKMGSEDIRNEVVTPWLVKMLKE